MTTKSKLTRLAAGARLLLAACILGAGSNPAIAAAAAASGAPTPAAGAPRGSAATATPGTPAAASGSSAPARNLTKTRPGSVLKTDKPWEEPLDLRGELARERDRELVKHYERMAELDVMATLAAEARDLALQERVEQVRRKEMLRHNLVMIRLRQDATAALAHGSKP